MKRRLLLGLMAFVMVVGVAEAKPVKKAKKPAKVKTEALIDRLPTAMKSLNKEFYYYKPKAAKGKLPLIIWLHGAGNKGKGLKDHHPGICNKICSWKMNSMVVQPRLLPDKGWDASELRILLDYVKEKYKIDENRIYVGGYSLGAMGTWKFAAANPTDFAAIVTIAGGNREGSIAKDLVHMNIWSFHGDQDPVVGYGNTKKVIDYLLAHDAEKVKFTTMKGRGHDISGDCSSESTFKWLLEQKKQKM